MEDAVVVDIFAKEDLTDMGLLSEPGNFLVSEAGDMVSELSEYISLGLKPAMVTMGADDLVTSAEDL